MKHFILVIMIALCACADVFAQFNGSGEEPAGTRWSRMKFRHYDVIYPQGCDSLAARYGTMLEKYRLPVSTSCGFAVRRMPVILHASNASAIPEVRLTPSRMEFSTLPQGSWRTSWPIDEVTVIYASRLASQHQFGYSNVFRPLSWFIGELAPGLAVTLYPDNWMLYGDAVLTTTALTPGGYGRYGEFINYYMAAFGDGDYRKYKWDRWMIGSYRDYTPPEATFGYLILSGLRNIYDNPYYIRSFLEYSSKRPYDIFVGNAVNRKFTQSRFTSTVFQNIIDFHSEIWKSEMEKRAPFTVSGKVSGKRNRSYTEYSSMAVSGDGTVYAAKEGMDRSSRLVCIDSTGKETVLSTFDASSSRMVFSDSLQRLFWSELRYDPRWKQKQLNTIRYFDAEKRCSGTLKKGSNVFNPSLSPSGTLVAAVCGPEAERTFIIILDGITGKTVSILPDAPEGVLFSECAWYGGTIYTAGISENGSGIYRFDPSEDTPGDIGTSASGRIDGKWTLSLERGRHTIKGMGSTDGGIYFSCDISGVFDLYLYDTDNETVYRLTSEKYGAKDFVFDRTGKNLYYSRLDRMGYDLRKVHSDSLFRQEDTAGDLMETRVTDKLTMQEKEINSGIPAADTSHSAPERYRKGCHMFRIHSWAPLYFDIDRILDMSGEELYDFASIGATMLTQNNLGTAYGSAGYAFRPAADGSGWVHGGHLKFTYTGWYPVIEGQLYINDRIPYEYCFDKETRTISMNKRDIAAVSGMVSVYVPVSLENGGKSMGIIPRLTIDMNNDLFEGQYGQNLTLSSRLYWIRDMAKAEIYPRFGFGIETGIKYSFLFPARIDRKLNNSWYIHCYGYLPGMASGQGVKITATAQTVLGGDFKNLAYRILPRGLEGTMMENLHYPSRTVKTTFEYAVPINLGDINITPLIYLNRMVITPHFDYLTSIRPFGDLYSAGATLSFSFGRIIWAFPFEIGLEYSYNGGSIMRNLPDNGAAIPRHTFRPVLKISL